MQALSSMKVANVAKFLSMYVCLGCLNSAVRIFFMWLKARRMHKMVANVPRARYADSPMGYVPEMRKNLHRRYDHLTNITKGQPVSKVVMGPKWDPTCLELFTTDPANLKYILKDNFENYSKKPLNWDIMSSHWQLLLGEGFFLSQHGPHAKDEGRNWLKQRKTAAPLFHQAYFSENMVDVFVAKSHRLCELLGEASEAGERADFQTLFIGYTVDCLMQIFFQEPSDTMGGNPNPYTTAFDMAHNSMVSFLMQNLPQLTVMKLLPWPFGGIGGLAQQIFRARHSKFRQFKDSMEIVDRESRLYIAKCRADPKLSERKDLLSIFVRAEQGSQFSPTWLRDVIANFAMAGREAVAACMSWMFYVLATHPEIQEKARVEVDLRFGPGVDPTIKDVSPSEMPYLNGVVYEVLRYYPPVPWNGKFSHTDDVLPDGTPVPAHTFMGYLPFAMGRDAQRYPEPDVIRPERWIPFKEPLPHEFPIFLAGPRACLGKNMALFEIKIMASMVLREFTFEMVPGEAEKISYMPTKLTLNIVNSKDTSTFDSHNLWVLPKRRKA